MDSPIRPTPVGKVDCAGCTACCRGQLIVLFPEKGDDVSAYQCHEFVAGFYALDEKPNGDCVYLGEAGCTIHDRVPMMCKRFDCRDMVKGFGSRQQRRAAIRDGRLSQDIHDAGMARMDTLESADA